MKLHALVQEVSFPKGHLLIQAGKPEHNLYFVKKGIIRAYTYKKATPVIFWFGSEGDTAISIKTYINNQPSYENIDLLEDSVFYKIDTRQLHLLYNNDIHIANWGRKFAEHEFLKTEHRLINMQFLTATERYEELMNHTPQLLQRVPLGYIASYLGISQVSLSRIRAGK